MQANIFQDFNSYTDSKWQVKTFDERQAELISQKFEVSNLIAKLFSIRNISIDDIASYLNPTLKDNMPDPNILMDMEKACERILVALKNNEKIAIFGDYDVDGSTSTSCLIKYFNLLGVEVVYHIPDRFTEGYGPNKEAFQKFIDQNINIIFTLDCGTLAYNEIKFAKDNNIDVIVIDHHQPEINLPEAYAMINPNRLDDTTNLGYLAAVGVTFMFIVGLNRKLRESKWFDNILKEPNIISLLDMVSLGTICDVVPLVGINRLLVQKGLEVFSKKPNIGLTALIDKANINNKISTYDLGFKLGPRINAGGRLGKSKHGTELLTCEDEAKAADIATELDNFNKERQTIEAHILKTAIDSLTSEQIDKKIIFAYGQDWHEGVIGIIASRIKQKFKKPCIVFSAKNGIAKGSGRSIKGIDLGNLIIAATQKGIVTQGGGHAMAAGLTLDEDKILLLQDFIEDRLDSNSIALDIDDTNHADSIINITAVNSELYDDINKLGPFGSNNEEPNFIIKSTKITFIKEFGDNHIRCGLSSDIDKNVEGITFRSKNTPLGDAIMNNKGKLVSLYGKIKVNEWGGRRIPQFHIEDIGAEIK
ncbi:MAG: single-stranded-DNA-specific exonuclease RecJ [Candidatus Pelagibacterales bacterium]|jgi:single-stranded-DNA-specific exonuclease|tara:strand:- start:612 stop:2384 length:1773 start_codon:yes stop_codon:yes gene_type:complete